MDDPKPKSNKPSKFTEDLTGTTWRDPKGKLIGGLQDLALKQKAAAKQAKPSDKSDDKTK